MGDRRCLGPNGADGSHETADSHPGAQAWVVVACVCDASPVPCDVADVYAGNAGCALHAAHGVGAQGAQQGGLAGAVWRAQDANVPWLERDQRLHCMRPRRCLASAGKIPARREMSRPHAVPAASLAALLQVKLGAQCDQGDQRRRCACHELQGYAVRCTGHWGNRLGYRVTRAPGDATKVQVVRGTLCQDGPQRFG